MRKKRILMLIGSVCLAVMLLVPLAVSCGPATPEEAAEEIAALESKLAAEKSKVSSLQGDVSDLEAEIAELRAPAEVYTGIFTNRDVTYAPYCDQLTDEIREMTDGQLDLTVVLEESIGRYEDWLLNMGEGLMQCGRMAVEYSSGIEPSLEPGGGAYTFACICRDEGELLELEYEYEINNIYQRMVYDKHSVVMIWPCLYTVENILSNVPIYGLEDLKGVKFRSAGAFARCLEAFGAKTVWFPGSEIYSGLASGLIEAVSYECPYTMYEMGLNEVTKYWTGRPSQRPLGVNYLMANEEWFKGLPKHLQACFTIAASNSAYRNYIMTKKMDEVTLRKVEEEGITVTSWSSEDMDEWGETWLRVNIIELAKEDPVIAECLPHVMRFLEDKGRPFKYEY